MSSPKRILFVCLGNICRSPAGEILLRAKAQAAGLELTVDSAGTANYHVGNMPDKRMRAALDEAGYPYDGHRGRQFCREDFSRFDLIIPQDEHNEADILRLARNEADRAKVVAMSRWFPQECKLRATPDPYYGSMEDFKAVVTLLSASCDAMIAEWKA